MIMRSGKIQGSLFGATDAADVPDRIASEMAEAFSGDIDFHRICAGAITSPWFTRPCTSRAS
jgi:hypothetical protein